MGTFYDSAHPSYKDTNPNKETWGEVTEAFAVNFTSTIKLNDPTVPV